MRRGGSRPGSGRKKGSGLSAVASEQRVELIEKAHASGEMPHMFLLRVARGEEIEVGKVKYQPSFKERMEAAVAAAAYFAPKLQAIEQKTEHEVKGKVLARPLDEQEWLELYGPSDATGKDSVGTTTGPTASPS